MGSPLSGRWGGRTLVEDALTLDIARLMRDGQMTDGAAGTGILSFFAGGRPVAVARYRFNLRQPKTAHLTLHFYSTASDGMPRYVVQRIELAFTVPHFGGRRWWMRCPVTDSRARTLHLPPSGDRFASREAWRLGYCMERLAPFDRLFEKLYRLQRKLGGVQGWGAVPTRPKGMWRRTFARHLARHESLDNECGLEMLALIRRMGAPAPELAVKPPQRSGEA